MFFESLETRQMFAVVSAGYIPLEPPTPKLPEPPLTVHDKGSAPAVSFPSPPSGGGGGGTPHAPYVFEIDPPPAATASSKVVPIVPNLSALLSANQSPPLGPAHVLKTGGTAVNVNVNPNPLPAPKI